MINEDIERLAQQKVSGQLTGQDPMSNEELDFLIRTTAFTVVTTVVDLAEEVWFDQHPKTTRDMNKYVNYGGVSPARKRGRKLHSEVMEAGTALVKEDIEAFVVNLINRLYRNGK